MSQLYKEDIRHTHPFKFSSHPFFVVGLYTEAKVSIIFETHYIFHKKNIPIDKNCMKEKLIYM